MILNVVSESLISAPFTVTAYHLSPLAEVALSAETTDVHGEVWRSSATFTTTADGQLDLTRQPARGGSYRGVDPSGLLWSLRPRHELSPAYFESPPAGFDVTLRLSAGSDTTHAAARRLTRLSGLRERPLREDGLYGTLLAPPSGHELRGACLCLGGSEGGLDDTVAALLASEGFLVLNLAYFGVPESGLPESLINVPLEYFHRALRWLRAHPQVAGRRLGVTGASKGGEAALLLGATFPRDVGAVAVIAGSGLVFEGIDRTGQFPAGQPMSSWSFRGQPLPYIPYRTDWNAFFSGPGPYAMTPVHREAVARSSTQELEAATIAAEQIDGPVLLVSGGEDQVWQAHELSGVAQQRRERAGLPTEHLFGPHAGHALSLPGLPTYVSVPWAPAGGNDQANAHLQAQAWAARLEILGSVWQEGT